ncbi:LuxR family transcriptional regulator [Rhizobium sp. ERR 1071]|uniref:helix-turn-helix transcriptional regulator n=1 Tax=Rhizobium sp. ERR 1071 TaxID=2572677 RepID=UPI00119C250A|nr:LuxR family transcriptional regulator [Rhizobium sp. ERR1071]TWB08263.1 LuxR family transcriptional regulator [Rhizobium sp. ERR1071]
MSHHWILPGNPIFPTRTLEETQYFLTELEACTTQEELAGVVIRYVQAFGATNVLVGTMPQIGATRRQQIGHVLINAWPNDWSARYFSQNYLFKDPTISLVREGRESFFWSDAEVMKARVGAMVMGEAKEFGLEQGFTMTLPSLGHDHVGFSIAGERLQLSPENKRNLALVASFAVYRALRIRLNQQNSSILKLTPREREVLQLAAEGWKERQIAARLGISDHAIDKYMRSCREKLGSRNTNHAIAVALRGGLIS